MKHEPRVTLAELGLERMAAAEIKAWSGLTSVEVLPDFLDRPSVSLEAAYAIAEKRRAAERAYAESEQRRRVEHADAVKALQKRVNDEFDRARKTFAAEHAGQPWFGGADEAAGAAVNWGLEQARAAWATAPAEIRDEVQTVTYDSAGATETIPLNWSLPLATINEYAARAARKR
ncbi:hypothetical protein [Kribbella sp. NPDC004536]|uniref:hypothetical protein n=1 Tax=Kribbella sp. NPDC004536 TaxID=3364106 RepID=UPI0036BFD60A